MALAVDAALAAANIPLDSITAEQRATIHAAFVSGIVDVQFHGRGSASGAIPVGLISSASRERGYFSPIVRAPASFKTAPARYKGMKHGTIALVRYEEYNPKPDQVDQGKKRQGDRHYYVLLDGTVAAGYKNIPDNAPISPSWDPNNEPLPNPQLRRRKGRAAARPTAAAAGEPEEPAEPAPAAQAPAPFMPEAGAAQPLVQQPSSTPPLPGNQPVHGVYVNSHDPRPRQPFAASGTSGAASTAPVGAGNAVLAALKDMHGRAKQALILERQLLTRNEALTADCAQLRQKRDEHAAAIRALEAEKAELEGSRTSVSLELLQFQEARKTLELQVTGLEGEKAQLHDDVASLQGAKAALAGEVAGLEGDKAQLNGDITGLRSAKAALAGEVAGLEGDKAKLNVDITGLQDEKVALEGKVADLRKLRAACEEACACLKRAFDQVCKVTDDDASAVDSPAKRGRA